jgi:hypothetical protein
MKSPLGAEVCNQGYCRLDPGLRDRDRMPAWHSYRAPQSGIGNENARFIQRSGFWGRIAGRKRS